MELKKILALAMLVLMAIPSLTMTVGADEGDGAVLAGAIERARIYLGKVRASAENLATEYPEDPMIQGYLNEIYDLLGQGGEADPEILLETTGDVGVGNEARIVIPMPSDFTLGDLETISWSIHTVAGYPAHVDITLDVDEDGVVDPEDMLTAEMAVNQGMTIAYIESNLLGEWVKTFELNSGDGFDEINDDTVFWVTKMGSGDLNAPSSTLGHWNTSTVDNDPETEMGTSIPSSATPVLRLEIEVDNWVVQTKAYVDDIEINGVPYDFEEEPEDLGAEGFLNRASACLGEGQFNSAARNLAAARNILGRVNGLLNSMGKAHKVARTQKFMQQFEHRIEGLEDKVERLRGRLGEGVNKFKASMGLAKGKLRQLSLSGDDVDLDELEDATELIDEGFGELEEDETSNTLEAMDRLEAHIRVLKASAERLRRKGYDTTAVDDELEYAEILLNDMMTSLEGGNTEDAESHIEETDELVSDAKDKLKEMRKGHQNKGSKGNGKGQGN